MLKPSEGTGNMYAAADDKVGQPVNLCRTYDGVISLR